MRTAPGSGATSPRRRAEGPTQTMRPSRAATAPSGMGERAASPPPLPVQVITCPAPWTIRSAEITGAFYQATARNWTLPISPGSVRAIGGLDAPPATAPRSAPPRGAARTLGRADAGPHPPPRPDLPRHRPGLRPRRPRDPARALHGRPAGGLRLPQRDRPLLCAHGDELVPRRRRLLDHDEPLRRGVAAVPLGSPADDPAVRAPRRGLRRRG